MDHIKIKKINTYKMIVDKIKKSRFPRVCIVGCLHGNEKIGEKIIKKFNGLGIKKGTLITLIGNYEASILRKRFIKQDLNRSFPGKIKGNYEEELAYKIKKIINECNIVFDVHSTTTDVKSLAILTKADRKTLEILQLLNPRRMILMKKNISKKAMINYCNVGISMEYGRDKSMKAYEEMNDGILSVLNSLGMVNLCVKRRLHKVDAYKATGIIKNNGNFIANKKIKNFRLVKKGDTLARKYGQTLRASENFYPVLFGEREYKNMLGFKARRLKIK